MCVCVCVCVLIVANGHFSIKIVDAIGEELFRIRYVANVFHYCNLVTTRPAGCASNDRFLRSHAIY